MMNSKPANSTSPERGGALRIWRPSHLESLELHLGTSFQHSFPRHWHDDYFLSAITAGAGHFWYRGSDHLAATGTLVWVAPGEVHTHYDNAGGHSFRAISIPSSMVAELAAEVTQRADSLAGVPCSMLANAGLLRVFLQLHQALDGCGNRLERESLLLSFFAELIPQATREYFPTPALRRENLAVRRAQEFLDEYYDREVSLKDLASLANLSPHHFHGVFCRQAGIPPHTYQIQLRIKRATKLLRNRWPIAHVAAATGFADQSHFTRHFKRLVGITPTQYLGTGRTF